MQQEIEVLVNGQIVPFTQVGTTVTVDQEYIPEGNTVAFQIRYKERVRHELEVGAGWDESLDKRIFAKQPKGYKAHSISKFEKNLPPPRRRRNR